MAQKVQVLLVDDLDGTEADETVTFALDGKSYEIDLTTANADKIRGLLEPYVKGGRRTSTARKASTPYVNGGHFGQDTAAIREWARSNGWPGVSNRGRVPAEIRDAFEKAHKGK
ncbi:MULTISPECIES: histone-like nucleoid-structuring protein Lsr2 [Streptomyces]|uniref:Lsr2 family protein n=2 Tax=Streptomyces TaxID=1883 RepID=A0ABV9IWT2_9ACTN